MGGGGEGLRGGLAALRLSSESPSESAVRSMTVISLPGAVSVGVLGMGGCCRAFSLPDRGDILCPAVPPVPPLMRAAVSAKSWAADDRGCREGMGLIVQSSGGSTKDSCDLKRLHDLSDLLQASESLLSALRFDPRR